ncbi:WhiB family transcriptional regulator [Amycolatopsis sulphurea]|nr:WhiB family transcriptional regulator [Amycolatopsis sulphurea]
MTSSLIELHAAFGDATPACHNADPELFWPISTHDHDTIHTAKQICSTCPVRTACGEWATRNENDGIWGGQTRDERGPARHLHDTRQRNTSPWRTNHHV